MTLINNPVVVVVQHISPDRQAGLLLEEVDAGLGILKQLSSARNLELHELTPSVIDASG